MRLVVIGGTGLIGSKTVERLRARGHDVLAAAPSSGVNTLFGEGLAAALAGANVVIDLANSPSFDEAAAVAFFETAGRNLLAAEKVAGVKHHVALSVVGTERLGDSGYFRGKMVQEALIRASGIPYTIVHSTQFLDFLGAIAQEAADGEVVRVSTGHVQPIASDDVAEAMAGIALAAPANGVVEIAGPERARMSDIVARYLALTGDPRRVVPSPEARYFGYLLGDDTLVPGPGARLAHAGLEEWYRRTAARKIAAQ
ncbi:SDR family oxidoreductase [Amaricoccus sp.]|uniref:SDR family oxidoreductase n=1 Tax=Amaricoccus sp. TaxID=1872485 RepID=UPI001B421431|nr:SDR family oxidoreductase [Amaricoccus sp.]MBP7242449.1 SDR family oxidoreductase [Amaricoccus sp.]